MIMNKGSLKVLAMASLKNGWCLLLLCSWLAAGEIGSWVWAPETSSAVFDQNPVSKVACGPASALNVLRFSKTSWRDRLKKYEKVNDEATLRSVLYEKTMVSSSTRDGAWLWSEDTKMTADDYVDFLNRFQGRKFWRKKVERQPVDWLQGESELHRVYDSLKASLEHGVAPTLEIVLLVQPNFNEIQTKRWLPLEGHFVVVLGVKKQKDALLLRVADSDGGRKYDLTLKPTDTGLDVFRPKLNLEGEGFRLWASKRKKFPKHQLSITGVIGVF